MLFRSREDFVEVDVSVKQDIGPQTLWEIGAIWLSDKVRFCGFGIEQGILFEPEHLRKFRVERQLWSI